MAATRIAIIGAGRIGRVHAANVAARHDLTLVAVCDAVAEAAQSLADVHGARAVSDVDAAIVAADAVMICAPTDTHADLIEACAQAGRPVFCEKPVDLDAGRIRRCLEMVRAAGIPLMIGFNRRFDPSFAEVRRRIVAGDIGVVELVTIISKDPAPPPPAYAARSGGLFRDMMIHDLDMARFLLGEEPVSVRAVGAALVDPEIGAAGDADTAAVLLQTASGRIAAITNSRRAAYGYDQRIEAHGALGMLEAGNRRATTVTLATASGYAAEPALPFFLERYAEAYRAELAHFAAVVREGAAPSPDGADGLRAQILADAATEAWRTGQAVALDLGAPAA
jgi:myo-inositol 2-dehydrogenase/D-chiro-inositol 1-dehydrogenase